MAKSKTIALLPLKANSERVPGKNFKLLAGKPLFRWVLDELLLVKAIEQVVINTDARETLAYHGLQQSERVVIRDRLPELCGDQVSMNRIIADDIKAVAADRYIMTHTTNPLITAATIKRALRQLKQAPASDSLFTVNKVQTRFYRGDGTAINHDPMNLIRTQDLEPWYEENSCLYIFTRESFARTGARIGGSPVLMETPVLESVDIDEPDDWEIAAALAQRRVDTGG